MSAFTSSPNTYAHHGPRVPDYHSGGFYFAGVRYKSQYGSMLMQPCRVQKKTANQKKCTTPVAAMAALYEVNSEYRTEMKKRYQALMFRCEHPWSGRTPYEVKENFKFSSEEAGHRSGAKHSYSLEETRRGYEHLWAICWQTFNGTKLAGNLYAQLADVALASTHRLVTAKSRYEDFNGHFNWKRGPSLKCPELNTIELIERENRSKWLRLSGGTDWQGFKGVYRTFENDASHPAKHYWLEIELRVNDIDATSICVVLSEGIRNWGPEGVIMQLVYDGHRTGWRFVLRKPAGMPTLRGSRRREVPVEDCRGNTTFTFLFFIDFASKYVVFYSNGVLNGAMEFASDAEYVGALSIYSWRSQSELLISNIILTKFESSLRVAPRSTKEGSIDIPDHGSRNDPRILIRFLLFIALPVIAAMAAVRLWSSVRYIF
ncbi:hypothetical protein FOL47_005125 [Perkinsus chesapeaki]|uniref:Uncharacterized protein n=1 Tax=Perkinsus chesapeaki TaxID=330153 RepID=A0A7J6LYZ1_PERCH|nr:hypothetical protein FOL47_005125 [Perkinsus chesapeaki]